MQESQRKLWSVKRPPQTPGNPWGHGPCLPPQTGAVPPPSACLCSALQQHPPASPALGGHHSPAPAWLSGPSPACVGRLKPGLVKQLPRFPQQQLCGAVVGGAGRLRRGASREPGPIDLPGCGGKPGSPEAMQRAAAELGPGPGIHSLAQNDHVPGVRPAPQSQSHTPAPSPDAGRLTPPRARGWHHG